MTDSEIYLIGAGGHAKVVHDSLARGGLAVFAYVDAKASDWLAARHVAEAAFAPSGKAVVVAFAGANPADLARRLALGRAYAAAGARLPPVIDPTAIVSPSATIEPGAQVLAGAIVNAGARVGFCAIVNTGAVIEHDASVGAGSHVAPRAVVLGGGTVGEAALIGAASVVLPFTHVADGVLVRANGVSGTPSPDRQESAKP